MLKHHYGVSLVELMVSVALSLLLLSALTTVFAATFGFNAENVKRTRLQQEGSALLTLIANDVRRANYRADSLRWLLSAATAKQATQSHFEITQHQQEAAASCLLFRYDANGDGVYSHDAEAFGYRLRAAAVERRQNSADCHQRGWQSLTNRESMRVKGLLFKLHEQTSASLSHDRITITLTIALPSDTERDYQLITQVALRNGV